MISLYRKDAGTDNWILILPKIRDSRALVKVMKDSYWHTTRTEIECLRIFGVVKRKENNLWFKTEENS